MKIILNSDRLYHTYLITDELAGGLESFFRAAAKKGHEIVIPETTLLEFERKQREHAEKERRKLSDALKALRDYCVEHGRCDPRELVREPNLIELIERTGVDVTIEQPTLEDFTDAHRRACLHESPHPPDSKSDEMRDLIIWAIATRIAAANKEGALLVSTDSVHTGPRGNHEATKVGLVRARTIEDALAYLQINTPAGEKIRQVFAAAWESLRGEGLPIPQTVSLSGVSDARFIHGKSGPASIDCNVTARSESGGELAAGARISLDGGVITELTLTEITVDDQLWDRRSVSIQPGVQVWAEVDDYEDRIQALRSLLT